MSLRSALKWSLLSELSAKAVQPLVFLLLARLLAPEDFGVMAACALVVSLAAALSDAGMARALVQYPGERRTAASAAFWINAVLGLGLTLAGIAAAPSLARHVFHDPRIAEILPVMALQVLLTCLGSVHVALLQKDLRFKRLFWIRATTTLVPALFSIPLALRGLGYWALVAGGLAGQALQLVVLWSGSPWRPEWRFSWPAARALMRFGGWAGLGSMLMWVYAWADVAIVGHFMGTHQLGIYRTGNVIVDMVFATLIGSLAPVLFGYFSGLQHDHDRIREVLLRVQVLLLGFALPVGIALFLFQSDIAMLLGARWNGIAPVIGIMGLAHALSWTMGANDEAYKAIGRPDVFAKILAVSLVYHLPAYWIAAQYGLQAFLWTRLALFVGSQVWDVWAMRHILGVSALLLVRKAKPVLYSAALYVSLHFFGTGLLTYGEVPGARLLGIAWYGCLVLGCYAFLLRRDASMAPWRFGH